MKFNKFILVICLFVTNLAWAQTECCVCYSKYDLYAYKDIHYCKKDFSAWIYREFNKACMREGSDFLKFISQADGSRQLQLEDAADDWKSHLDAGVMELIRKQEAPRSYDLNFRKFFSGTISWALQSLYALKTWNNVLCCCFAYPEDAEECALSTSFYPKVVTMFWGNPYYERCPHCLSRIERLKGCPEMKCSKCKTYYAARQQIECPLVVGNVGCYCCICSPCGDLGNGCWAIGACDSVRCKVPCCVVSCSSYVCECPLLVKPEPLDLSRIESGPAAEVTEDLPYGYFKISDI